VFSSSIAPCGGKLYSVVDGKVWKWDGRTPCTARLPGLDLIDMNRVRRDGAQGSAIPRHVTGTVEVGRTHGVHCDGMSRWTLIDTDSRTQEIAAGGETLSCGRSTETVESGMGTRRALHSMPVGLSSTRTRTQAIVSFGQSRGGKQRPEKIETLNTLHSDAPDTHNTA